MSARSAADRDAWPRRYAELLDSFLRQPGEEPLREAADLGCQLAEAGVPLTEVTTVHLAQLEGLVRGQTRAAADILHALAPISQQFMAAYGAAAEQCRNRRQKTPDGAPGAPTDDTLRLAERRFREVLDHSGDMLVCIRLADRSFEYVGRACEDISGFTADEVQAAGWEWVRGRIHPDDRAVFDSAYQADAATARSPGRAEAIEFRFLDRAGTYRWHSSRRIAVRDEAGQRVALISSVRDISDQKRSEDKLRLSEQRYRALAESAQDIIYIINCKGDLEYVNEFAARQLGLRPEDMVGHQWATFFLPEEVEREKGKLQEVVQSGRALVTEARITLLQGTRWVHSNLVPLRLPDGEVYAVLGITRDITDRKQAEQNLRHERDQVQQYLDIAEVMFVVLDVHGRVLRVNKKTCATLARRERDVVGQSWFDLFVPEHDRPRVKSTFSQLMTGGIDAVEYYENAVLTGAGEERLIAWHNAILRDEAGNITGTLSAGEDITARRKTEQEVQHYQEHLEELVVQRTRELEQVNARLQQELSFTKHLVSGAPAIICRVAPDGTANFINPAGERITGYRAEELIGRNWLRVFYPGEEYRQVERLFEAFQKGDVRDYEMVLTTRTGTKRTISWNSINRRNAEGELIEIIGLGIDITEHKQADLALQESEERFRQLAENMSGFFWLYDLATRRVLYVGPGYEHLWGQTRESVYADPNLWLAPVHPDDRAEVMEGWRRQRRGETTELVYRVCRDDGSIRWVRTRGFPIRDASGAIQRLAGIEEDVTAQREADRALRVFKTVSDRAGHGSAIADMRGKLTYVNEAFAAMHGRTVSELIGRHLSIFHSTAQMPYVNELNERLIREGCVKAEEVWHLHADGHEFPTLMTTTIIQDEQGQPEYLAATAIDITARKQAEEAVRRSREYLDRIINCVADPIFVKDRQHRMVLVNDALCVLIRHSREEVIGKTDQELFPQAQVDIFSEKDELVLQTGLENVNEEQITDARGYTRTIVTKKTRYVDPAGAMFLVGVIRDITDYKRAEEAVRQSEHRFRTLAETVPVAITITSGSHVLYVNPAAEAITGRSRDELLGLASYWEVVHPDFRDLVRDRGIARERGESVPSRYELKLLTRNGQERWVELSASYFEFDGNPATLATGIDITDRKRAEEQLRIHQDQLAHMARLVTTNEMASGLAHELAQPLSAILFYARACAVRLRSGSWGVPDAVNVLDKVARQAERGGAFIQHLRTFVRRSAPCRAPTDLNALVREMVDFVMHDIRSRGIRVHLDLASTLPNLVVDPIQIEQVVLNLIRNGLEAMDALPPGERRLEIRTERGPKNAVCVSVQDSGHSLTPEIAARVFDPFFTTKATGLGLGLSISRSLIESHDGELWLRCDPLHGATFGFTLPDHEGTDHVKC